MTGKIFWIKRGGKASQTLKVYLAAGRSGIALGVIGPALILQESSCVLLVVLCGYVGNAFALSKRSGISTALVAASILAIPSRHTAIGVWLFIAW